MARDEGFSIISVNSDGDDEVVIQVGVPAPTPLTSSEESVDGGEPSVSASLDENDVVVSDDGIDSAYGASTASATSSVGEGSEKEEGYRLTNEKDLEERGPFPQTRLAILVGALLLIIVFVVYYALAR